MIGFTLSETVKSDSVTIKLLYRYFPKGCAFLQIYGIMGERGVNRMRILIVEDEKDLAMVLAELLALEGYYTDTVHNGEDGLDFAQSGIYDVIVLDVMLPKLDGLSVLRTLRKSGNGTPVLLLTAKSELEDKVSGLDSGADDYLTKPFHSKELLARIRALGRRREKEYREENVRFSDIMLDREKRELQKGCQKIGLTRKEYDILELLMLHPRQRISKEQLITKIWGYDADIAYNSIEVYISFLRKKLAALNTAVSITTSRGLGYTLEEKTHG